MSNWKNVGQILPKISRLIRKYIRWSVWKGSCKNNLMVRLQYLRKFFIIKSITKYQVQFIFLDVATFFLKHWRRKYFAIFRQKYQQILKKCCRKYFSYFRLLIMWQGLFAEDFFFLLIMHRHFVKITTLKWRQKKDILEN